MSSGTEAIDRKQRIRDRYRGVDTSELEVIPAKIVEGLGESTSIRRVAAMYVFPLTMMNRPPRMSFRKIIIRTTLRPNPAGSLLAFMMMKESAALRWHTAKECSS